MVTAGIQGSSGVTRNIFPMTYGSLGQTLRAKDSLTTATLVSLYRFSGSYTKGRPCTKGNPEGVKKSGPTDTSAALGRSSIFPATRRSKVMYRARRPGSPGERC